MGHFTGIDCPPKVADTMDSSPDVAAARGGGGGGDNGAGGLKLGYAGQCWTWLVGRTGRWMRRRPGGCRCTSGPSFDQSGGKITQGRWLPAGFQSPGAHVQAAGEGSNEEEGGRHGADCRGQVDQVHHGGWSNGVQILRIILKELNSANMK